MSVYAPIHTPVAPAKTHLFRNSRSPSPQTRHLSPTRYKNPDSDKMTAVFCTYQSLPLIEKAQEDGAPPFDVIFCDEAHRTTGVEAPGDKTSPFVLVHDADRIRANKRLYMTATPRLYTEGAKTKAARHDTEVFSMDEPEIYGPEFHRLPFFQSR